MPSTDTLIVSLPNGTELPVTWNRSWRSRQLRLSFGRSGLRVSTPPLVPKIMVQKFLNAQKIWIMEQQLKLQGHSEKPTLLYAGKHHEVILQPNHGKEPIVFEEDRVIISPFDHSVEGTTKVIDRFLKAQAAEDLLPLLTKTGQEMGIEVPAASLRDTSSRWGSCSYRGAISLSWRLIHAPHEVRRYVVVHELAHRIHFNHSDRFWQLVSQYDPEHPLHRGWLKRHGHLCRTPDVSSLLT